MSGIPGAGSLGSQSPGVLGSATEVSSSINRWQFEDILFGGLIDTLMVDPITGGMWTLEEKVSVDLVSGVRLDKARATDTEEAAASA